ncbi:GGDEF domain-containing protein [Eisenbergiella sp.]
MGIGLMEKEILELQEENSRLKMLSEADGLTGLYNRVTAERMINERLNRNESGSLLVVDVDGFKRINDRYGHLFGDEVLKGLAALMKEIFPPGNVIGRFGGDEFIIFTAKEYTLQAALKKGRELIRRMQLMGDKMGIEDRLSATIGAAGCQEKDTYASVFSRADYALFQGKKKGKSSVCSYDEKQEEPEIISTAVRTPTEDTGIDLDMELIWMELREKTTPQGAYCQDYETFKHLYRFVERGLMRVPSSAYTILLTLMDDSKQFVMLQDREILMEKLGETIGSSLRSGDVYTQYSSCQYLLMVMGTSLENASKVVERIRNNYAGTAERYSVYIGSNIRPLQSAGRGISDIRPQEEG